MRLKTNHTIGKRFIFEKSNFNFQRRILPEINKLVKAKVKNNLDECKYLSFTSDIWTANTTNHPFISLTAVGISKNWNKQNFVLAIEHFEAPHSGERIANCLSKILNKWGVNSERIHAFLTDSGANILKVNFKNNKNFN